MAINESITGDNVSTAAFPAANTSDVIIEPKGPGKVVLQVKRPGSSVWVDITGATGSFSVITPDSAVSYRFKGIGLKASTPVYFGP